MGQPAGFQIRLLRWEASMKQFELAALLGLRPARLSEIELGRVPAPEGLVERVRELIAKRAAVRLTRCESPLSVRGSQTRALLRASARLSSLRRHVLRRPRRSRRCATMRPSRRFAPSPGRLYCARCRRRSSLLFVEGGRRICRACREGTPLSARSPGLPRTARPVPEQFL